MQKFETNTSRSADSEHDYRKHVNQSLQWSRWILKPICVWPIFRNASDTEKYLHRLINVTCYGLISFLFFPCAMFVAFDTDDVYLRLKLIGPLSFCVMAFMKYSSLILQGNTIRECVERIEWDWKNVRHCEDRNVMMATKNFGQRLATICTFFTYSSWMFYYIAIPLNVGTITAENSTFIPLLFPFSNFLIDTRCTPVNEIIFFLQILAGALIHGIAAGACNLAVAFVVHACGQMDVLICWLNHLVDGREDMCDNVDGRIAMIVSQHVRTLKFLARAEKALQQISFVEFCGCSLDLCLLGYYILKEWDPTNMTFAITYIILLVSLTFNVFIFCYVGELVAEQCRKVGRMAYMTEWYRLTGKRKLCFVMIIAMSKFSTKLTAGNIVVLSLTVFSDIIKTSFAFMNLLRRMT